MLKIDGKHPTYGAMMLIRLRRDGRCIDVKSAGRYYRNMLPEEAAQKLDDVFEKLFDCEMLPTGFDEEYRNSGESPRFRIGDEVVIDGTTVVKTPEGWREQ
jgi:hypothetical protein